MSTCAGSVATTPRHPCIARERLQFYSVPKLERFNEAALRATVRRELAWLLNTTNFGATADLEPYPHVATSVLNYGISDLAGKGAAGADDPAARARNPRRDPHLRAPAGRPSR